MTQSKGGSFFMPISGIEMREIVGYAGRYSITPDGRVWGHRRGGFVRPYGLKTGYLGVLLGNKPNRKHFTVHRLVAQAYVPNPGGKPEVNHKDRNKANNAVSNLEWTTHQKNRAHAGALAHDPELQAAKRQEREDDKLLDAIRLHPSQTHLIPTLRALIDTVRGPEKDKQRLSPMPRSRVSPALSDHEERFACLGGVFSLY